MPTPPYNSIHSGAGAAAASSLLALVPIVQMLTSGPIALLQNAQNTTETFSSTFAYYFVSDVFTIQQTQSLAYLESSDLYRTQGLYEEPQHIISLFTKNELLK